MEGAEGGGHGVLDKSACRDEPLEICREKKMTIQKPWALCGVVWCSVAWRGVSFSVSCSVLGRRATSFRVLAFAGEAPLRVRVRMRLPVPVPRQLGCGSGAVQ